MTDPHANPLHVIPDDEMCWVPTCYRRRARPVRYEKMDEWPGHMLIGPGCAGHPDEDVAREIGDFDRLMLTNAWLRRVGPGPHSRPRDLNLHEQPECHPEEIHGNPETIDRR